MLSARSNITYINSSLIPATASEIITEQYFSIAFVVLLTYDILVTFDKEVKYFWGFPVTTVKVVYFAVRINFINTMSAAMLKFIQNRYLGVLCAVAFMCWNTYEATPAYCNFASWSRNIINWSILIMFDYILMIRVLALYSRDKRLSLYLKALLAFEATLSFAITIYATQMQDITAFGFGSGSTICGENNIVPLGWGIADWSISAVYGVVLLILALYKAIRYWRMSDGLNLKSFGLVKLLIRDQIVYFLLIIFACIFNIMQFKVVASNVALAGILEALGNPALLCIAGSRMLINLKEAGEGGLSWETTYSKRSMSGVEFARR